MAFFGGAASQSPFTSTATTPASTGFGGFGTQTQTAGLKIFHSHMPVQLKRLVDDPRPRFLSIHINLHKRGLFTPVGSSPICSVKFISYKGVEIRKCSVCPLVRYLRIIQECQGGHIVQGLSQFVS